MPRESWIQTYTGRKFFPLAPRVDGIEIEDIAHALANICRFNGHCRHFYSVAQHSVFVAEMLPPELRLNGLMHDAAEAYLSDICQPIKHLFLDQVYVSEQGGDGWDTYRAAESRLRVAIAKRLGLDWPLERRAYDLVKHADEVALATEARDLLAPPPEPWGPLPRPRDLPIRVPCWSPVQAEMEFLSAFVVHTKAVVK